MRLGAIMLALPWLVYATTAYATTTENQAALHKFFAAKGVLISETYPPISGPEIGAAVIGAGFIGPVHVEALQRAGVKVTGILGVSDEESQQAAKNLRPTQPGTVVFTDDRAAIELMTNALVFNFVLQGGMP